MTPVNKVSRRVEGKEKVSFDQLKVISEYNKGMGGVDLLDMLLGSYRPNLRSKKWWWPLFANALNIAVVAAFKIHKKVCVDQLSHLDILIEVAEVVVRANHEAQKSAIRWSNCFSPRTNKIRWSQSHLSTNVSGSLYLLQK